MKKIRVEVFVSRNEPSQSRKFEGDDAVAIIDCAFKWIEEERKKHPEMKYRVSEIG